MKNKQKILITGSEGLLGKLIVEALRKERHELVLLDKNSQNPVDLLKDKINSYFNEIETLIHLAANPNPFIKKYEANKNIEIAKRVIDVCEYSKNLNKIINASSINVYPYIDLFEQGKKLTQKTLLSPNLRFGNGNYGSAKIETEKLFKKYCKNRRISLLNLRLGCVTSYNRPCKQQDGHVDPIDYEIHLKHSDLIKIINKGLTHKGIKSYVCVSKKNGFIDKGIRFPI